MAKKQPADGPTYVWKVAGYLVVRYEVHKRTEFFVWYWHPQYRDPQRTRLRHWTSWFFTEKEAVKFRNGRLAAALKSAREHLKRLERTKKTPLVVEIQSPNPQGARS